MSWEVELSLVGTRLNSKQKGNCEIEPELNHIPMI